MDALAQELALAYSREIYPVLAAHDPEYRRCLLNAGVGWTARNPLPPGKRQAFEETMRVQASLGAIEIRLARSLDPGTVRVKVLEGPMVLYRMADRAAKQPYSIWWFSEKVATRCRREAGPGPEARRDWLRNVLAVCYNWNPFTLVQRLALHGGERIPAVLGKGLPMPYYKLSPQFDRKTGLQIPQPTPRDYWEKKGRMLFGGELQIVLPWIPIGRIAPTTDF